MAEALPPRFIDLKKEIASTYPDFAQRATEAWAGIIEQLQSVNADIAKVGSGVMSLLLPLILELTSGTFQYIPQVNFKDLDKLGNEDIENIKRRGCLVIKDVVDDTEAIQWRKSLVEFIKANPEVEG